MFSLDALQDRWVWLALAGGVVLVLATVQACLALWRPRKEETPQAGAAAAPAEPSEPAGFFARVPWFLALTMAGLAAYAIIYVWVQAMHPPNW